MIFWTLTLLQDTSSTNKCLVTWKERLAKACPSEKTDRSVKKQNNAFPVILSRYAHLRYAPAQYCHAHIELESLMQQILSLLSHTKLRSLIFMLWLICSYLTAPQTYWTSPFSWTNLYLMERLAAVWMKPDKHERVKQAESSNLYENSA